MARKCVIAKAYHDAGKLDLALPLFEETLKIQKAKLGPDHPDTVTIMNNLAQAYQAAGKLDLALLLHQETLKPEEVKKSGRPNGRGIPKASRRSGA